MTSSPEQPDADAPSVFGARNQDEMIARIGATAEDDLASSFFDSSIQDVEDAAVRMFDVGIKTITEDPAAVRASFGASTGPDGAAARAARAAAPGPVAAGADGQFADPAVRAAFILGGPGALAG